MIDVQAPLTVWRQEKGAWYFLKITGSPAAEIRVLSMGARGGFGSVRVSVQIGSTRWRTSVFPDRQSDGFLLPVKAQVRKDEGIEEGSLVQATLDIL